MCSTYTSHIQHVAYTALQESIEYNFFFATPRLDSNRGTNGTCRAADNRRIFNKNAVWMIFVSITNLHALFSKANCLHQVLYICWMLVHSLLVVRGVRFCNFIST